MLQDPCWHFYYKKPLAPKAANYTEANVYPPLFSLACFRLNYPNILDEFQIFKFQQGYYTPLQIPPQTISLGELGFAYIPKQCQNLSVGKSFPIGKLAISVSIEKIDGFLECRSRKNNLCQDSWKGLRQPSLGVPKVSEISSSTKL